jgi:outer membrane protein OmpA-like peptidoglycan-associated protein
MHRPRTPIALLGLVAVAASGCSATRSNVREREWNGCAIGGAIIGATIGGVAGGVTVNNVADNPTNGKRGGAIAGGIVGGGLLGTLLGHVICDPEKPLPAPPPVAEVPPPPVPGEKLATIGAAHFDFDKAVLKPSGRAALDGVVKTLNTHRTVGVYVNGYTDSVGSDAYNLALSKRRADAVKAYLVEQGISSGRIETRGFGKSDPIASNATEAGRAANRRAEVVAK